MILKPIIIEKRRFGMWNVNLQGQGIPDVCTLKEILREPNSQPYAVGSFSPRYTKLIAPILRAAIAANSPAIIQISEKEIARHKVSIGEFAAEFYRQVKALKPHVPLALHLDHTVSFDIIKLAIDNHFTSVMIDASRYSFDDNVRITKEVVAYAHTRGVSVEAELGKIGTTDFVETDQDVEMYTDPEEARQFCYLTGVDALAVSVGTAHGLYTTRQPKIDFGRLEELKKATDTPLVLHGASGVPTEMLTRAVSLAGGGVSKVNIATDIEQVMLEIIGEPTHITEEKLNGYEDALLQSAQEAVQILVEDKIRNYLLSDNKA
jgi:fructose-bisphosphate aldolase class II